MSFTHGDMNQKLISGLTATLLISTLLGFNHRSSAEASSAVTQLSEADQNASSPLPHSPIGDVVKVGEQQSQTPSPEDSIAKIQTHEHAGRKAATLYVRNIPVLTFIGSQSASSNGVKMGATQTDESSQIAKTKPGSVSAAAASSSDQRQNSTQASQLDPVTRSTAIAAKLNQLHRQGVDAKGITVRWKQAPNGTSDRYIIEANKTTIVAVDADTILPDTTKSPEQDALQVTNRLRRLIGNAGPLREVPNKPNNAPQISLGPIKLRINGWASWYGPGFDGNASASGETFNQNAMTAAHRSLAFGTRVQVTNLDNGRSVIVRINDRGPFVGNRVIDLSAGAARVLGVIQTGIAPVRLEVMSSRQVVSAGN